MHRPRCLTEPSSKESLGLRKLVAGHQEDFARTFTQKLLGYALGRSIEAADFPAIREITRTRCHWRISLVISHHGHRLEHAVHDEHEQRAPDQDASFDRGSTIGAGHVHHEESDSAAHDVARSRCTLALPLLDAMVPSLTALQNTPAKPITRFGVMYVPNGMVMEQWTPVAEGAGFELTSTLAPLAPFRENLIVLSNLACVPTPGRPGGAHAKASTRFLTDISPPTSETWLDAGISMDQIAAREMGASTQLASLELAVESGETAGACDVGFACAYTNTISWLGAAHAAADGEQSASRVRTSVR